LQFFLYILFTQPLPVLACIFFWRAVKLIYQNINAKRGKHMRKTRMKRAAILVSALALTLAGILPALSVNASAAEPETYNHYYGLLHAHTSNSDGKGTYEDAFGMAKNAGLDFFACTEHSEHWDTAENPGNLKTGGGVNGDRWTNGLAMADKLTKNGEFVAIMAYEVTWSVPETGKPFGHINVFNTPGYVSTNNPRYALDGGKGGRNFYDDMGAHPTAIGQYNHPSTALPPSFGFYGTFHEFDYWTPERDSAVSLIEIGNGDSPKPLTDLRTLIRDGYASVYLRFENSYNLALSKGWHVGPVNTQDNHNANWGVANDHRTVILAKELTRPALFEAMANRRVYATEDKNMKVDFTINGEVMGSILDHSPSELNVSVKASTTTANIGRIDLVGENGKVIQSKTFLSKTAQWEFTIPVDQKYYYIKIGPSFTFTAPIWVNDHCRVIFDNGSSAKPVTVRRSEPVAKPADPVRKGFTFQGWFVNGKPVDFNKGIQTDTVMKAAWKPKN